MCVLSVISWGTWRGIICHATRGTCSVTQMKISSVGQNGWQKGAALCIWAVWRCFDKPYKFAWSFRAKLYDRCGGARWPKSLEACMRIHACFFRCVSCYMCKYSKICCLYMCDISNQCVYMLIAYNIQRKFRWGTSNIRTLGVGCDGPWGIPSVHTGPLMIFHLEITRAGWSSY